MFQCYLQLRGLSAGVILLESDNLIPELPNTGCSCGQYGPVACWFRSAWPGNVTSVPKTYTLLGGRNTLSIAIELLLLRLNFVFY
jgi:hypothetical protein